VIEQLLREYIRKDFQMRELVKAIKEAIRIHAKTLGHAEILAALTVVKAEAEVYFKMQVQNEFDERRRKK
jgi:DNA-binding response OmpR family regulator